MNSQIDIEIMPPLLFLNLRLSDRLLIRIDNTSPRPYNIMVEVMEEVAYITCEVHASRRVNSGSRKSMSQAAVNRLFNRTVRKYNEHSSVGPALWREKKRQEEAKAFASAFQDEQLRS